MKATRELELKQIRNGYHRVGRDKNVFSSVLNLECLNHYDLVQLQEDGGIYQMEIIL